MSKCQIILIAFAVAFPKAATVSQNLPETTPFWGTDETRNATTGMTWRDCNNDGFIDVFYSNGNDYYRAPNTIYISLAGQLPTSATWTSADAEYSGHCAVGDIDDDGFPDFAIANFLGRFGFASSNHSQVYLNSGGLSCLPHFSPDWYTADSIYSFSCALGDVDNDGDLDLALATGEPYGDHSQSDRIYFNVNGSLQTTPGWQSAVVTRSTDVAWGDVDRDGDLDLAAATDDLGAILYRNENGNLETSPSWQSDGSESSNSLTFADVNGDDWLDLVVAFNLQLGGNGHFSVFYNDGTGSLQTAPGWQSATGGYGSAVSVYDVDNDGDQDLAAGRWWDRLRIYENLGTTFTDTPVWRADISSNALDIAWVDVDAEGVEPRADTVDSGSGSRLHYLRYAPLYSIDSIVADGIRLGHADYCYDLVSGWVSLAETPVESCVVHYQYSFTNDLAIANGDSASVIFASRVEPYVDIEADVVMGKAPLTVHFSNTSPGASSWLWRFGDGDTALSPDPVHIYDAGGAFDVYLETSLPGGWHARRKPKMIITFGDTLLYPDKRVAESSTFTLPVYLRNAHPLYRLVLTVTWAGELDLHLTGYDVASCRTSHFEIVELVAYDQVAKRAAFSLRATTDGSRPPLEPGYGSVLNLHFAHVSGGGATVIDTTSLPFRTLLLDARYIEDQPVVVPAIVTLAQLVCGDINGDEQGPDVTDLAYLVDFFFRYGPAPPFPQTADLNGADGFVNILDLTTLTAYLYRGEPDPECGR